MRICQSFEDKYGTTSADFTDEQTLEAQADAIEMIGQVREPRTPDDDRAISAALDAAAAAVRSDDTRADLDAMAEIGHQLIDAGSTVCGNQFISGR